ncbi:MAG: carboxypeptidase-like regulatory domain-containing protein [Candidatus Acidiferrales bacterium]|jgi:hypothetical protein
MRREVISKLLISVLSLCVCSLLSAGAAKAQNLYGSIRGTVTDSTGATVPGATVTVTNMATNAPQQTTSKDDGSYSFLQLAIGDYAVKAEKTGFQVFAANRIHVDLDAVYTQNITLTLGTVSQEVTVQANQVQVETTSPQLGTVIEADQIVNMPLIGRNWVQLQQLQPGVVTGSDRFGGFGGGGNGTDYATNGGESQFNNFLVDGTDTNDILLNTTTVIVSPDAIAEFRMATSTMNPEYARSSGAVVNAIIKSGSNSFHGDGFDFYRDTFLNAVSYGSTSRTPYHENIFGGTVGGPVIKNHTFFFFSYQGRRLNGPQVNNGVENGIETTNVYTPAELAGTFGPTTIGSNPSPFPLWGDPCPPSGPKCAAGTPFSTLFASGNIPTQDFSSLSTGLVTKYVPAANFGAGGACTASLANPACNEYKYNATANAPYNQYLVRIDQNFNSRDTIWGTWLQSHNPVISTVPFIGSTLPGFSETDDQHFKFLSLAWTHVINDHMVNELRGGYNRFNYAAVNPTTPMLPSSAGFDINPQLPSGAGLPFMNVKGFFNLGFSEDGPQPRKDQVYQGVDNLTIVSGRHTLKLGFDMHRWQVWNPFSSENNGAFTFTAGGAFSTGNAGLDFLLGIPAFYGQGSGALEIGRTRQYYSYAQDQYKLRPNLTLTFGSGWTIDTPVLNEAYDGHGQAAFRPGQQSVVFPNAPLGVVYQGDPGVQAAGSTKPFKYFGPRVGFAYSPNWGGRLTGGPGKTSIRGGFGIYYDRSETEQSDQVVGMPPFAITSLGALSGHPAFANPFNDITGNAAGNAPNPFPYAGPSSSVQFTAAAGFLPIFGSCCSVLDPNVQDPMAENYNLTLERQLSSSMILTVGYVGSVAHHLSVGLPLNVARTLDPTTGALVFPYDPGTYGSIDEIFSIGNSRYNALEVSLNKHFAHGLQFLASYTYSHSIDDTSGFENSSFGECGASCGGFATVRTANPYCFPQCSVASSIYDARHRLVISYFYEIPGMRSNWWISRLTKGWTIAGITTFQTGFPLDVADEDFPSYFYGTWLAAASDFTDWDGPDQVAPVKYENPRKTGFWFNPSSFAPDAEVQGTLPAGTPPSSPLIYGNAPRNPLRGPGLNNWDFQVYKDTAITERTKFELRIDFYNFFNHTQFDPNGVITDISNPNFGEATAVLPARRIQLGGKFYF